MLKYRHGDVGLFAVDALPKNLKLLPGTTVALGEVTGHHHTLYALDEETKIKLFEYVDGLIKTKFIEVKGGMAELRHQEHKTIVVDPGVYEIKIERTYSPFVKQIKQVLD